MNVTAWCPTCQDHALTSDTGLCVWCDTPIATPHDDTPVRVIQPKRGNLVALTSRQLTEARRLYYQELMSLNQAAKTLLPATRYVSHTSLAQTLSHQFKLHGWPVRGRVEETVRVSTIHGLSPRSGKDPAHVRALKVARGTVRDVMCAAVRTQYPRKGQPCQRPALAGGDYCHAHDPKRAAARAAHLAAMRASRAA